MVLQALALDDGWRCEIGDGDPDHARHRFTLDTALPGGALIEFQGLATRCDVLIDGALVASHDTMFRPLWVQVPHAAARLEVVVHPLQPGTARRPRWRNRLVPGEALRTVRTSLLGRIPGTGAPVIGPFRPILLHPPGAALRHAAVSARMDGADGLITVRLTGAAQAGVVEAAGQRAVLHAADGALTATLRIPAPPRWWPHTHGEPHLIEVSATLDGQPVALGRTGFRTLDRVAGDGFGLVVNGAPVFCRGALWTGGGLDALVQARDAGANMIRVPGYALYPGRNFFEACDALGLLVWQDFMFARFDYPDTDAFLSEARAEAAHVLSATARHPSLVVLCGGHEATQAAAMAGRPHAEWAHPLFDTVLPEAVAAHRPDVPYVANSPSGGALPFAASAGVAHYFGVGPYRRPLAEARAVRFAAACLAFSNPEDPAGVRALCATPGDAAWAAAVPRDPGAAWTFEDTRDQYAADLFGHDPAPLRRTDPERWLVLGRAAVALAMQQAFTLWRTEPACHGALVLALQDRAPGPGWGLLGHDGRPKSALHALNQVWRPVQALLVDAGLDGVVVHVLNETAAACPVRLVLRGLTPAGATVVLADEERTLPPRSRVALQAVALMGRFQDLVGTWGFGPPPYTVLGVQLLGASGLGSEATLFPAGPARPQEDLGLAAARTDGGLMITSRRFAQFVAIDVPGCVPDADHFHLWPDEPRRIRLAGDGGQGSVSALNGLTPAHIG